MSKSSTPTFIVIRRNKKGGHGHHGGAWKIAYADFVTAMMAFFLLMWLLSSVTKAISGWLDSAMPCSIRPMSRTASVARSPETMRLGKSRMRAAVGSGGASGVCCATSAGARPLAIHPATKKNLRRAAIREL